VTRLQEKAKELMLRFLARKINISIFQSIYVSSVDHPPSLSIGTGGKEASV
jgi:hypothetical protein